MLLVVTDLSRSIDDSRVLVDYLRNVSVGQSSYSYNTSFAHLGNWIAQEGLTSGLENANSVLRATDVLQYPEKAFMKRFVHARPWF